MILFTLQWLTVAALALLAALVAVVFLLSFDAWVRCADRSCYRPRPWALLAAFAVLCAAVSYIAP
jgi:hypothetical protein